MHFLANLLYIVTIDTGDVVYMKSLDALFLPLLCNGISRGLILSLFAQTNKVMTRNRLYCSLDVIMVTLH